MKGRWDSLRSISGEKRRTFSAKAYQGSGKEYQLNVFNGNLYFPKQVNIEWPPTKSKKAVKAHQGSPITIKAFKATEQQWMRDQCTVMAK